jgi:predicted AAA+ superfamily ATPase
LSDLEKEADRLRLDVEWESIVAGRGLAIFDEAQEMPALFPRLRAAIDEDRKRHGRFLLLGSVSPFLMRQVAESLAGRLALCELTPLLAGELPEKRWDDLWRFGGYPDGGVLDATHFPDWQRFYLDLLAQRDLPHWGLSARATVTQRLFRMLAAVHGQAWNASQIGKSLEPIKSSFAAASFPIRCRPWNRSPAPTGPALKNEMMLPAVLDPWAGHALYEAANLAKNRPAAKSGSSASAPKPSSSR